MPRMLDLVCSSCGAEVIDKLYMTVPALITCEACGGTMEQVLRPRPRAAQWSDRDSIVVFRKPDGTFSYPAVNTKPTPQGCTRVVIKSHAELRAFERQAGVVAHISNYDRGSGRSLDDSRETPPSRLAPERERYERFRKLTEGVF